MQDPSFSETPNPYTYLDSPIGRLNLDILYLIFKHVADDSRPRQMQQLVYNWARLGHVCHVWRSALLSMPELWARDILAFGLGSALDDILPRAQDVPLDLEHSWANHLPSTAIERIAPLIPRARVLACTIATLKEQRTVLDAISSQPTPVIHTLKLNALREARSHSDSDAAYTTCIQHLPIRQLEVRDISISPPLMGSLTALTLRCYETWIKHERLTLEEILTALAHNPRLEKLVLYDVVRETDSTEVLPHVALPSLRTMHIFQSNNPSSYDVLDHLRFPEPIVEDAMLGDAVVDTATGVSANLTSALAVYAGFPVLESARYLRFQYDIASDPDDQLVEIHVEQCHHFVDRWRPTIQFDVSFETPEWQASFSELSSAIIRVLVESPIPEQVTELSWNVANEAEAHTSEYWEMVLRPFIATETLFLVDWYISNTEVTGLIAMLDALARTRSDGPLLPRLHRLVMCDENTDLFQQGSPELRRALIRRAEMHVPIREIRFLDVRATSPRIASGSVETLFAQIQELVAGLGVNVERQECWEEIDGKMGYRGTEFVLEYHAQNVINHA